MKKLFVSIPLKGRSKEEIQDSLDKIKEAAEGLLGEKVDLLHQEAKDVPEFTKDDENAREALKFLSKDLDLMADADYFATIDCNWEYRHCEIEESIFRRYFLESDYQEAKDVILHFPTQLVCPDVAKKERERAKELWGKGALPEVASADENKD